MKWLTLACALPICSLLGGHLKAQQPKPQQAIGGGATTAPGVTVQFASGSYAVNESDGSATLTVTLAGAASGVVTVNYATSNGTALAGTDYTSISGAVTFPQGVTSQVISVGILDNGNYSNQTVSFTVALSNPVGAALGAPSIASVNILDNDPAPTCSITINGAASGYVPVNANNDNGSALTYDGTNKVPAGYPGIPATRDFAVPKANLPLKAADPDLAPVALTTTLKVGAKEAVVLSVIPAQGARGRIALWDQGTKNNVIAAPTRWTQATMPGSVYVEGILESAALNEITLQLQIQDNKGAPVNTQKCVLTVTPVLTNFTVTVAKGAAPNAFKDPANGWSLNSEIGGGGAQAMTSSATAQWNNVKGDLRFIQTTNFTNNLTIANMNGSWGADLGPRNLDFDPKLFKAGTTLVDSTFVAAPLYPQNETNRPPQATKNGAVTNQVDDSPALVLENDPGLNNPDFSVLPDLGKTTNVDVTYNYVIYATVAYTDKSLYFVGQQSWTIRFAGAVTQPANKKGTYTFTQAAADPKSPLPPPGNNGATFSASVINNKNPAAIGQPFFNNPKPPPPMLPSIANDGGVGFR